MPRSADLPAVVPHGAVAPRPPSVAPGQISAAKAHFRWAVLLASSLAGTAHAQDYLGSWLQAEEYGRQLERTQEEDGTRADAKHARGGGTVDAVVLRQLSYVPSARISRTVNTALAGALVGRASPRPSSTMQILEASFTDNPRFRDMLARQVGGRYDRILGALESGVLQSRFRLQQQRHGYSADNMADANNAFRIRACSVLNDGRLDEARAYAALQVQLRRALAGGRLVPPHLDDAVKQDNVEILGLLSMLIGAAFHNSGNARERSIVRAGVENIAARMGFDPRTVVPTDQGAVQR